MPAEGRSLVLLCDVLDIGLGIIVTDHAWVRYTESMKLFRVAKGQRFRFTAIVSRYTKKDGVGEYGLQGVKVDHLPQ